MRLCNAYNLLPGEGEIRLKCKAFKGLTAILTIAENKLPYLAFERQGESVDPETIPYSEFSAIMQNETWEPLKK